ncbi:MAG: VCBS repeat-containing protein, partial [Proteobacteria bacterium]|nr:VCBS repeat-containing protein [Pseudomonadota bacterium]
MNKKYIWLSALSICLFVAGCSDDKAIENNNETEGNCGGKQCTAEQECKNDVCVDIEEPEPEPPEDDKDACKKTENTCKDSKTQQVCVKGKKPVEKKCSDGNECKDGKCVNSEPVSETQCKETVNKCLDDDILSICVKGEEPVEQKCSESLIRGACRDNECVNLDPELGSACDGDTICPDGSYCDFRDGNTGICVALGLAGESCELSEECSAGLECDDWICKNVVEVGEACGDLDFCSGDVCENGICSAYSTMYGECGNGKVCPVGSICIDSECVPTKGECDEEHYCTGDSYCCVDPETCGKNLNVCVPYSTENSYDPACLFKTKPGIFEASVQCYWKPTDTPNSVTVYNSVAVGKIHNNKGIDKPLLAFITESPTMIRIVEPDNCETVESISISSSSYNNLTLADLDGDGFMEIIAYDSGMAYYYWNGNQHVRKSLGSSGSGSLNGTLSVHDLDNDGVPEIISTTGDVYRADGTKLSKSTVSACSYTSPELGDLDRDGNIELITNNDVYRWMPASNGWSLIATVASGDGQIQAAYADFGTPGNNASSFDFMHFDGRAELVLSGGSTLQIWAIFAADGSVLSTPQQLMRYQFGTSQAWGYPPAIGDFNGDGKPEVGVASRATFGVYDPKCKAAEVGKCVRPYVVWENPTHDTSGIAGASAFDFDGDNKIEIVYGDECYTRVYDGATGEVLFSSYRNSGTVIEYPIIADVDDDGSTEIVVPSDTYTCGQSVDPSHRGVMCKEDADCYSGSCVGGLCRCQTDDQCNWQTINNAIFKQYSCMSALAGDETGGNVCRAIQGTRMPGITILRDRLDRWVSSRTIWNQHAYNITNINDDGSIPKTSSWQQNFNTPGLNNYRQQVQGTTGAGVAPDITGRFTSSADACIVENN